MKPVMNNLDKNINDVDNEDICYNKQKYELEQLSKSQIHTIKYAINKGTIESTIKTNNLFYPDLDRIQGRFNDGVSKDNLYKEFGNPYIVCLKDSAKYESFFYDQIISADQLNTMIDSIEIIPTTYKAINGTAFKYLTSFSAAMFENLNKKKMY